MLRLAILCTTALFVAACKQAPPPPDTAINVANEAAADPETAPLAPMGEGWSTEIRNASGKVVGLLSYVNGDPKGLPLTIRLNDFPPGDHGMHLHQNGKCEGPKFESAGAHWNPGNRQHGRENPQGSHAGDMPNITVDSNGRGKAEYLLPKGSGEHPQGLSLVIHANRDDDKTDPSGNSGDRIACAVLFEPGS